MSTRHLPPLFLVLLLVSLMIGTFISRPVIAKRTVPIGTYYYLWYDEGFGNRHWNDSVTNIVVDEPLFNNYYDSQNVSHVQKQISMMADIGIDFVIISWWGNNSYEDDATKTFIEANIEERSPIRFCIMVQNYTASMNYTFLYEYIYDNYAKAYSQIYLKWEDKPVLCWFSDTDPPMNDTRFTERMIGQNVENIDWIYYPELGDNRVSSDGCISVAPRWDTSFLYQYGGAESSVKKDQNYTEGMYDAEWKWVIDHHRKIDMVLICTWNEYHERTMIEPHKDRTASAGDMYIYLKTRGYIEELRKTIVRDLTPAYYIIAVGFFIVLILGILIIAVKRITS